MYAVCMYLCKHVYGACTVNWFQHKLVAKRCRWVRWVCRAGFYIL